MRRKHVLGVVLLILICVFVTLYLIDNPQYLHAFQKLSVRAVGLILLAKLIVALLNAEKFRQVCSIFGLSLRFSEWFGLTVVTTMAGYFMPARTNVAIRAWYLRRSHGFEYLSNVPLLVGANMLDIVVALMMLITCAGYLALIGHMIDSAVIGGTAVVAVFLVAITALFVLPSNGDGGDNNCYIARLRSGFSLYLQRPTRSLIYGLTCGASLLSRSIALWICCIVLGVNVDFPLTIVAVVLASLTIPASVVPGNLGITEGVLVAVMALGGVTATESIAPILLSRAGSIAVQFSLGALYFYIMLGFFRDEGGRKAD